MRLISTCGKMVVLDKMLRRLRADGHKVLIFSQFQRVRSECLSLVLFNGPMITGECSDPPILNTPIPMGLTDCPHTHTHHSCRS